MLGRVYIVYVLWKPLSRCTFISPRSCNAVVCGRSLKGRRRALFVEEQRITHKVILFQKDATKTEDLKGPFILKRSP